MYLWNNDKVKDTEARRFTFTKIELELFDHDNRINIIISCK